MPARERICPRCGERFEAYPGGGGRGQPRVYCSDPCRTKFLNDKRQARLAAANPWRTIPRTCPVCGREFCRTWPNQRHCSSECGREAQRRATEAFKARRPDAMAGYNRTRVARHGPDRLSTRLRRRYPDLPVVCEARGCGEGRVLEIAHKPAYRRNGAWRTMDKYERHMFWMLCPTCHRVLDWGVETPAQLGLE